MFTSQGQVNKGSSCANEHTMYTSVKKLLIKRNVIY